MLHIFVTLASPNSELCLLNLVKPQALWVPSAYAQAWKVPRQHAWAFAGLAAFVYLVSGKQSCAALWLSSCLGRRANLASVIPLWLEAEVSVSHHPVVLSLPLSLS